MKDLPIPGFKAIPQTGVIYVTSKASERGFSAKNNEWANLGQGSPQSDTIPGAPPRITSIAIAPEAHQYSAVAGNISLRQRVADFYNERFRKGLKSQYTYENVCIAGGGRQALARLVVGFGNINMGHFLPDYTAYEELLSSFKSFTSIPILLERENDYKISLKTLEKEILGRGLRSLLISNPCNPTGQLLEGQELQQWVEMACQTECSLIFDEFYSHYIYTDNPRGDKIVSASAFIEDVNQDPIIIVDGLTKNWRYPGWRISWIVGPRDIITSAASSGSFLDGGANHPFQHCAEKLLDLKQTLEETQAIHDLFSKKREYMVHRLKEMGILIPVEPKGGFYVWADLSNLPPPLNNSHHFFEEGLLEKVITVPGYFFDVNPGGRRIKARRFTDQCRISFGPENKTLDKGLSAIEKVIKKFS